MHRRVGVAAAVVVVAVGLAVAAIVLSRPGGLSSRPASSIPALLSEPAGVPGAGLVLAPDGLGPISFGDDAGTVIARLTELLGAPVEEGPQPCDAESDVVGWVRWGNLSVAFADGRFSGYVLDDSPESLWLNVETPEGVRIGTTAAQLTDAYGDRLAWTGQSEFAQVDAFGIDGFDLEHPAPAGLGGYVEGGIGEGRVISLGAGQRCGAS